MNMNKQSGNCVDGDEYVCGYFSAHCSDIIKVGSVSVNEFCPLTCNKCRDCVDEQTVCGKWARIGLCDRSLGGGKYVKDICKLSCKNC
jgi:hypothetical protein